MIPKSANGCKENDLNRYVRTSADINDSSAHCATNDHLMCVFLKVYKKQRCLKNKLENQIQFDLPWICVPIEQRGIEKKIQKAGELLYWRLHITVGLVMNKLWCAASNKGMSFHK